MPPYENGIIGSPPARAKSGSLETASRSGRAGVAMNMNLVLATGLAYAFIGALIMFLSHRSIYRRATGIVAGYPKVLAALRAQRQDARFGLIVLLSGNIL